MAEITSLVINFNGSNNSTNFIDETGKTITLGGSPIISTTQSKFGGSSGYFNGGSYLDIQSSTNFSIPADFTVELWVYTDPSTAAWSRLIENEQYNVTGGWHFSYNGSDSAGSRRLGFQLGLTGGGGSRIDSDSAIPTNQWVHIAVTRYNNTIRMFVDGVKQTATLTTTEAFSAQSLRIGATLGAPTNYFTGYIDSIQIIKNRALYSENFTVPTEQFQYDPYYDYTSLLIPFDGPNNSTVFGDYSPNRNIITAYGDATISTTQSKFGGSSLYISGNSGCAVKIPYNLKFDPETNDFTIESWVYPTARNASYSQNIVGTYSSGSVEGSPNSSNAGWFFGLTASNGYLFFGWGNSAGSWNAVLTTSTAPSLNSWSHIALVKNGSTITIYLNGTSVGTATYSTSITLSKQYLKIGSANAGGTESYYFYGYIDDVRIIKGVARYTGNFTVPSQSFYKLFNYDPFLDKVSLLLHMDGDNNSTIFKDSSVNTSSITVIGNSKISTTQSKIGGSSGYFDGTTDALKTPQSTIFTFGTGNFTIEFFIYLIARSHTSILLDGRTTSSTDTRICIFDDVQSTGKFVLFDSATETRPIVSTTTPQLNTWYHIALSRSNGNTKLFVDGVQEGSTYSTTKDYSDSSFVIGASGLVSDNYNYSLNGYLDELRITKGVARYTTNFTPPVLRFYDLITVIEYFYGVYTDFIKCAPGEAIGDHRSNSVVYIDENLSYDIINFGEINIQGYYKINKTPVYRKIFLCTYPNYFIIRETWSNPITGFYSFNNVKKQDYILIFEDYENLHHSKIRRLFMDQL